MFRGGPCRFFKSTVGLECLALTVAAISLICAPSQVSAQSRKIESIGTVLQTLLPLAGAFCAYRQSDIGDYSTRFVGERERDYVVLARNDTDETFYNGTDDRLALVQGGAAAVSGAGYLNDSCISSVPGKAVVGGLAAFANASDLVFKDQEIGVISMGSMVGFKNENLKFRLSRRSVKLKFTLDF